MKKGIREADRPRRTGCGRRYPGGRSRLPTCSAWMLARVRATRFDRHVDVAPADVLAAQGHRDHLGWAIRDIESTDDHPCPSCCQWHGRRPSPAEQFAGVEHSMIGTPGSWRVTRPATGLISTGRHAGADEGHWMATGWQAPARVYTAARHCSMATPGMAFRRSLLKGSLCCGTGRVRSAKTDEAV